MTRAAAGRLLAATPLGLITHMVPWPAALALAALWPVAYICRSYLQYKLASKALDKAPPEQAAAVMTAITTHHHPTKPSD
jgi:hypothetical protein